MSQIYFTELGAVGGSATVTHGVPLILAVAAIAADGEDQRYTEHWILKRGPASDSPALAYSKGRRDC